MEKPELKWPKWAGEVLKFIGIDPQIVLWGNIYDYYLYPINENEMQLKELTDYITEILLQHKNYQLVLAYDRIDGFELLKGDIGEANRLTGLGLVEGKKKYVNIKSTLSHIEKFLFNEEIPVALIFQFSSFYTQHPDNPTEEEEFPFFTKVFKMCYQMKSISKRSSSSGKANPNTIFWLVNKINDLPAWHTVDNSTLKIVGIPKPDSEIREKIIRDLVSGFLDFEFIEEKKKEKLISIFLDQTEKMFARDLQSIVKYMFKERMKFTDIEEAIRFYKLGISENRWAKIKKKKLLNGDIFLSRYVKGQKYAISKALDIVKRAYVGIDGSQWGSYSNKPRGTLFLAGPTGVGKTELAKALTKLIFGSEQNYIRFDMSEFNHEHTDQRLIGAPPGYVGYQIGGELTNAVKQNPFAVILFDEIEKAHPRILDKFLQILEDGRLTDGRGDTVYFSEALIIFTSNLGVYEEDRETRKLKLLIKPEEDYETVRKAILKKIEEFFKYQIQRPEILNRLGENIIVFDFIRGPVAEEIFSKMLDNVKNKILENTKIRIEIPDEVYKQLLLFCKEDLSMGGRGIGNRLEEIFVNPLSRTLFEEDVKANSHYTVEEISLDENNIWKLRGSTS